MAKTTSEQTDYAIVSDFHLAEGKRPATQRYSRHENFLSDRAFEQFLLHLEKLAEQKGRPWTLIFNGDLLDFLRVTSIPSRDAYPKGLPRLTSTKRKYGLGTSPAESKWQLERIVEGHTTFFRALAGFLLAGNEVIIIKGNHDVNWFWPEVRYRFLELLGQFLSELCPDRLNREKKIGRALDRLHIRPWSFHIEGLLYVEHGNQYDSVNAFRNFLYPILEDPYSPVDRYELDLPFGSFFCRYFYNKVEYLNPIAPNYRHSTSYFYSLWRRRFYETWNLVSSYFPYFFRTLGKLQVHRGPRFKKMREHNLRLLNKVGEEYGREKEVSKIAKLHLPPYESKVEFINLLVESPLKKFFVATGGILLFSFLWSLVSGWILSSHTNLFFRTTFSLLIDFSFILLGLLLLVFTLRPSKTGTRSQEAEPKTLRKKAARIAEILDVKYITFGHTHMEDVWKVPGRDTWYFNTGTWIPLIDDELRTLRPDRHYPVMILEGDKATLRRWNEATGELEELPLLEDRIQT